MGFIEGFNSAQSAIHNREMRRMAATERNNLLVAQGYNIDKNGNIVGINPGTQADVTAMQLKEQAQLLQATQAKVAQIASDDSLDLFGQTGDARNLQIAMDNNPDTIGKAARQRGVLSISNIDFENDANLLTNAGLQPSAYDTEEKRSILKKSMFKLRTVDGEQIGLADQLAAEMGSLTRMGPTKSANIINNKKNLVSLLSGPKAHPYTAEGHKYEQHINKAAEKYNLPPNLIAAMIQQESSGDPNAVSPKGAGGLMQLLESTARDMGVTDRFNVGQNIDGGAKYLREQLDKYGGDLKLALAAYNAGPARVDEYGGIPPFSETRNYVNKILSNLDGAEAYYGGDSNTVADDILSRHQRIQDTILEDQAARVKAQGGMTKKEAEAKLTNDVLIRAQEEEKLQLQKENLEVQREKNKIELQKAENGTDEKPTSKQRDLASAEKEADDLKDKLGVKSFTEVDVSTLTPEQVDDFRNVVMKIEGLTGRKPDTNLINNLKEIKKLVTLSEMSSDLDFQSTGASSTYFGDLYKFISDDVNATTVQKRAAFEQLTGILRKSLSGVAVTPIELKNFTSAYGSSYEGLGSLAAKLSVTVEQIQADIDAVSDTLLPVQSALYLGVPSTKLKKVKENLNMVKKMLSSGTTNTQTGTPQAVSKSAMEVFGE